MKTLTTTGARILFGIPFLIFGIFHFMNASAMAGMVPLPGGAIWVYLTGLALIAAAISLFLEKMTRLACLLLALMLLIFILTVHLPGVMAGGDQQATMQSMTNLLKDFALMAAALGFAGKYEEG